MTLLSPILIVPAVAALLCLLAPSHRLMRETLANGGPNGTAFGAHELQRAANHKWIEEPETICPPQGETFESAMARIKAAFRPLLRRRAWWSRCF